MIFDEERIALPDIFDPEIFRRERERARRLRDSSWWRNKRAKGICHYCGRKVHPNNLTMDHIIPLSRGGTSIKENIAASCKECNRTKSHMLPAEWSAYLDRLKAKSLPGASPTVEPDSDTSEEKSRSLKPTL
jgi:5-methylcytosine-specific restriction endonuclease McrA